MFSGARAVTAKRASCGWLAMDKHGIFTTRHTPSVARFHTTSASGDTAASKGVCAMNARPETRLLFEETFPSRSWSLPWWSEPAGWNLGRENECNIAHESGSHTVTVSPPVARSEPSCEKAPAVKAGAGYPECDTALRHRHPARSPARPVSPGTHIFASPLTEVVHAIASPSRRLPLTETLVTNPTCGASHTHTHVNPRS